MWACIMYEIAKMEGWSTLVLSTKDLLVSIEWISFDVYYISNIFVRFLFDWITQKSMVESGLFEWHGLLLDNRNGFNEIIHWTYK